MSEYSNAIKEGCKPQINSGTASTTVATINTLPGSKAIKLYNRDTGTAILYSIDNGTTYLSLPPFGEIDECMEATKIMLYTASGTAAYDLKVALRQ